MTWLKTPGKVVVGNVDGSEIGTWRLVEPVDNALQPGNARLEWRSMKGHTGETNELGCAWCGMSGAYVNYASSIISLQVSNPYVWSYVHTRYVTPFQKCTKHTFLNVHLGYDLFAGLSLPDTSNTCPPHIVGGSLLRNVESCYRLFLSQLYGQKPHLRLLAYVFPPLPLWCVAVSSIIQSKSHSSHVCHFIGTFIK